MTKRSSLRRINRWLVCGIGIAIIATTALAQSRRQGHNQLEIEFVSGPPDRARIWTDVPISWRVRWGSPDVQCRSKLDAPRDWRAGLDYILNKWSEWGAPDGSVTYSNFIEEGDYRFTVQCRSSGQSAEQSVRWRMFWEFPEIREEAIRINWEAVTRARTRPERFAILAAEYRQAHEMWMREFEYRSRLLKLTTSPEEIVRKVSANIVGGSAGLLLNWADKPVAKVVSRILSPKLIYDLIHEGMLDLILIYRNGQTNKAASMAIVTAAAAEVFEQQSRRR